MYSYFAWALLDVLVVFGLVVLLAVAIRTAYDRRRAARAWDSVVVKFPIRAGQGVRRAA